MRQTTKLQKICKNEILHKIYEEKIILDFHQIEPHNNNFAVQKSVHNLFDCTECDIGIILYCL